MVQRIEDAILCCCSRGISEIAMRLQTILLSLLLLEARAAPRKKRDIGAVEHEHPHHAVSFFDSFFSFFGGGSDSSPITSVQVHSAFLFHYSRNAVGLDS